MNEKTQRTQNIIIITGILFLLLLFFLIPKYSCGTSCPTTTSSTTTSSTSTITSSTTSTSTTTTSSSGGFYLDVLTTSGSPVWGAAYNFQIANGYSFSAYPTDHSGMFFIPFSSSTGFVPGLTAYMTGGGPTPWYGLVSPQYITIPSGGTMVVTEPQYATIPPVYFDELNVGFDPIFSVFTAKLLNPTAQTINARVMLTAYDIHGNAIATGSGTVADVPSQAPNSFGMPLQITLSPSVNSFSAFHVFTYQAFDANTGVVLSALALYPTNYNIPGGFVARPFLFGVTSTGISFFVSNGTGQTFTGSVTVSVTSTATGLVTASLSIPFSLAPVKEDQIISATWGSSLPPGSYTATYSIPNVSGSYGVSFTI